MLFRSPYNAKFIFDDTIYSHYYGEFVGNVTIDLSIYLLFPLSKVLPLRHIPEAQMIYSLMNVYCRKHSYHNMDLPDMDLK